MRVDARTDETGKSDRARGHQDAQAENAEQQSRRRADGRQYATFGEKLAPQSQPSRSQSHAQRNLSLPRFGTRQQKVRNIGAGNQEYESHSAQQGQSRRPDVP